METIYAIDASNELTHIRIAKKCTLVGALSFANDILDCWDDVFIKEYPSEDANTFKLVARLSSKGLTI